MSVEEFQGIFVRVVSFLIVPIVVFAWTLRKKSTWAKSIFWYCLMAFMTSSMLSIHALTWGDNRFYSHFLAVFYTLGHYFIFRIKNASDKLQLWLVACIPTVFFSVILVVVKKGFFLYNYTSLGLMCVYTIVLCTLQIHYTSKENPGIKLSGSPMFWIASGFGMFYISNLLTYSFYEYYVDRGLMDELRFLLFLTAVSRLVFYLIPLAVGLMLIKREKGLFNESLSDPLQ